MNWLDKLERKFGRKNIVIRGLMKYIVILTGMVFAVSYVEPSGRLIGRLALDPAAVMKGEIWRLITFIFIPPEASPFWIIFVLYFYYLIGTSLEQEWGSFKFNVYYLFGIIGTIIAAFISNNTSTSFYLNLSLFLAFAHIYPDYEVLLFFVLPIKIKYLGWLNWAYIIFAIVSQPIPNKIAAVVSIINFFIFFARDFVTNTHNTQKAYINKRKFQSNFSERTSIHKCTICGITEKDDPNMEFRYCSKCEGDYEYCMKHLKNHEHIKK